MVIDQVVQGGVGVTFEGVKKNNCCMLITKKLGIQADSGVFCPYLGIKATCSLKYGQKAG